MTGMEKKNQAFLERHDMDMRHDINMNEPEAQVHQVHVVHDHGSETSSNGADAVEHIDVNLNSLQSAEVEKPQASPSSTSCLIPDPGLSSHGTVPGNSVHDLGSRSGRGNRQVEGSPSHCPEGGAEEDLRDARTTIKPCEGNHSAEGFRRGSQSGVNGHALWLTCHRCKLRLLYVPVHGAKGCYRSPGPMGKDVVQKLVENPEASPSELNTKALALEAAENSAKKLLDKIQVDKAKMKAKAKPSPGAQSSSLVAPPQTTNVVPLPCKTLKRSNEKIPEQQEVQVIEDFQVVSSPETS